MLYLYIIYCNIDVCLYANLCSSPYIDVCLYAHLFSSPSFRERNPLYDILFISYIIYCNILLYGAPY